MNGSNCILVSMLNVAPVRRGPALNQFSKIPPLLPLAIVYWGILEPTQQPIYQWQLFRIYTVIFWKLSLKSNDCHFCQPLSINSWKSNTIRFSHEKPSLNPWCPSKNTLLSKFLPSFKQSVFFLLGWNISFPIFLSRFVLSYLINVKLIAVKLSYHKFIENAKNNTPTHSN